MRQAISIIFSVLLITSVPSLSAENTKVASFFTISSNIRGSNYCKVGIDRRAGKEGFELERHPEYAVEQRWDKTHLFLFLLKDSYAPEYCGIIMDYIDLSGERVEDHYFLFHCRIGRQPYARLPWIIGYGSNHYGQLTVVRPSKAWKPTLLHDQLTPINVSNVTCDTSRQ